MEIKTALITGANKGIGYEIARQLGQKNYTVILAGRDLERLKTAQAKLIAESIKVEILVMDVSSKTSIETASEALEKANVKLDVLVNNAAVLLKDDTQLSAQTSSILQTTLATNVYGPLQVVQSFLPYLKKQSHIINISSGGGSMTDSVGGWSPAYCVSKTMLNALTRHLAAELASKKISVNAVCPGWVKTDMGGSSAPRTPAEGAETPVWLASEAEATLTGKFFRDKKEIPW